MATITKEEWVEYPTFPKDTILHVKVDGEPEVKTVPGKSQGSTWEKLEFKFKILGVLVTQDGSAVSDYDTMIGTHIYGSVPWKFNDSPDNKLNQWSAAILGMDLGLGFDLDTKMLADRQCRAITSTYDKRAINPRTGLPFVAHQVESLLPMDGSLPPPPATGWGQAPPADTNGGWGAPATDPWAPSAAPVGAMGFADEPPFHHRPQVDEFGIRLA